MTSVYDKKALQQLFHYIRHFYISLYNPRNYFFHLVKNRQIVLRANVPSLKYLLQVGILSKRRISSITKHGVIVSRNIQRFAQPLVRECVNRFEHNRGWRSGNADSPIPLFAAVPAIPERLRGLGTGRVRHRRRTSPLSVGHPSSSLGCRQTSDCPVSTLYRNVSHPGKL